MHLPDGFWASVGYVAGWFTLSTNEPQQAAIGGMTVHDEPATPLAPPIFKPPGGRPDGAGPGSRFKCNYSMMPDANKWEECSLSNSSCWLRRKDGSGIYDIGTDYERSWPTGIDRYYDIEAYDSWFNADGVNFTYAKLFNSKKSPGPLFNDTWFPGPWIQACWGDTIHVNVTNKMKHNGTSVHWHGLRQLFSMHMDGVNGVTQCPIAPGDHFEYIFKATQYGSSWYHSHYSVQYADGLQGPITIHGPSSAQYDEPKIPLIMTDWGHNSSFSAIYSDLQTPSILLNGRGNVEHFGGKAKLKIPAPYEWDLEYVPEKPKRYLLRLINTSFATAFIFSIDDHILEVVAADFVPIKPYRTKSILILIGQRYDVIIEAKPVNTPFKSPKDMNFWIRTQMATGCSRIKIPDNNGYERTGVLRYDSTSNSTPTSTIWPKLGQDCLDDEYRDTYQPVLKWKLDAAAANGPFGDHFQIRYNISANTTGKPYQLARFSLERPGTEEFTPLRISYENPTFFHLDDVTNSYPRNWVVVPEDVPADKWIYLVLTHLGGGGNHPMHLHGHDFAMVQYNTTHEWKDEYWQYNNLDNPPRRDVVNLPASTKDKNKKGGFVVIAFKADNPGNWLFHCHIAFHASNGLGLQILESRAAAQTLYHLKDPAIMNEATRVCKNWSFFFNDCRNWAGGIKNETGKYEKCDVYGINKEHFQDDSGV